MQSLNSHLSSYETKEKKRVIKFNHHNLQSIQKIFFILPLNNTDMFNHKGRSRCIPDFTNQ